MSWEFAMGVDQKPSVGNSSASPVIHAEDSLGPFQPPADYHIEEELQCDPPRPIPPEARQGRLARKQRNAFWVLFFIGVMGLICSPLPIVRTWGLYFLPLQYLLWISVACLSFAFLGPIARLLVSGPYRYIEEGIPLVARIRELILQPALIHNGQPVAYRFVALIEYCDSLTGQITVVSANSSDFGAASRNSLTTSFKVGDYVTAIYLPKNPAKSLRLYGFLDLRPDIGLIATEHREETGLVKLLLTVILGFGFFGALLWNVYAFGRYSPLEWNFAQLMIPFAAGRSFLVAAC
jgi:hypothetical protein